MPSLEFEGTIEKIFETNVISDRFQKRDFVVKVEDGQYPQEIALQFTQADCDLLDNFKEGDNIRVKSWVRGRKWQRTPNDEPKWFNSLVAYSLEKTQGSAADDDEMNQDREQVPFPTNPPSESNNEEDFPF
ncbi:MAG: DUF3127 domain-containing protein [Bernardetiaceae bacterium]|nr:DUF3127 domain-containing protein [Bernardetiaceae bacterium]